VSSEQPWLAYREGEKATISDHLGNTVYEGSLSQALCGLARAMHRMKKVADELGQNAERADGVVDKAEWLVEHIEVLRSLAQCLAKGAAR